MQGERSGLGRAAGPLQQQLQRRPLLVKGLGLQRGQKRQLPQAALVPGESARLEQVLLGEVLEMRSQLPPTVAPQQQVQQRKVGARRGQCSSQRGLLVHWRWQWLGAAAGATERLQ